MANITTAMIEALKAQLAQADTNLLISRLDSVEGLIHSPHELHEHEQAADPETRAQMILGADLIRAELANRR